jgi:transposase
LTRAVTVKLLPNVCKKEEGAVVTTQERNCSAEPVELCVAFELGERRWVLALSAGPGQRARRRTIRAGDLERVQVEIEAARRKFGLEEPVRVASCYEAGREGFWLHRFLVSVGIDNVVVDSSSIEVDRRARRAKSDGLDADRLLAQLWRWRGGDRRAWRVVRVPSVEAEDGRQLHRELETVQREGTRVRNRIRGLLATHGVRLGRSIDLSGDRLERMRLWDGSALPVGLRSRLERDWTQLAQLTSRKRELERQRRSALSDERSEGALAQMRQLTELLAIGPSTAWTLVREAFGWRKFRNRRELGGMAGMVPTPYQSGKSRREQGISRAGNRYVRTAMVELAWRWIRFQPTSKLTRWFLERFAGGGPRARKVGIVALARRLLIELWRYLEHGVVPEGARLRA